MKPMWGVMGPLPAGVPETPAACTAAPPPPVHVAATEYTVTVVTDAELLLTFAIKVEWRGGDRFAVVRHGRCLARSGQWDPEPFVSEQSDEWLAEHRFGIEEALALARAAAPKVMLNPPHG